MSSVILAAGIAQAIRAHGVETYAHECCGALIGTRGAVGSTVVVSALVPLPNTTEEGPRRRFLVRPADYRLAERRAIELGAELLGFYHSHPDHPARPSQYDLEHAWPTFAYVIVSVRGGGISVDATRNATAGDMTVWFLADDRSAFSEGTLSEGSLTDGDHNPDSDTAAAVHGEA